MPKIPTGFTESISKADMQHHPLQRAMDEPFRRCETLAGLIDCPRVGLLTWKLKKAWDRYRTYIDCLAVYKPDFSEAGKSYVRSTQLLKLPL
jgi:hypothetical protein